MRLLALGGPGHGRWLWIGATQWAVQVPLLLRPVVGSATFRIERVQYERGWVALSRRAGDMAKVPFLLLAGDDPLDLFQAAMDEEGCGPAFAAMCFEEAE